MITDELKNGIHNIELALISNVRRHGGKILEDSFEWNYGLANEASPEIVFARISANGRRACLILPREYCEDSALKVNRSEVWDAIQDCLVSLGLE